MRRCFTPSGHWQHGDGGGNYWRRTLLQFGQRFKCIFDSTWSILNASTIETNFATIGSCILYIPEATDMRCEWTLHWYRCHHSSTVWCDLCVRHGKSHQIKWNQKSSFKFYQFSGLFSYTIHGLGSVRRRLFFVYISTDFGQKQSQRNAIVEP